MCAYLYLFIIYGYCTYKHPLVGFKLTLKSLAPFKLDIFLLFLLCGTMFHSNVFISSDVASLNALDAINLNTSRGLHGLKVHQITDHARALIRSK